MSATVYRPAHQPLVPPGGMECFARDMTVIISADVQLVRVQTELAQFNQWLPIDGDEARTVGELVERNSTGPLRLGYGAWRDLLLGCQFRNGVGELITAGGRAVKNVAGYDLTKFMVGQQGVFGSVVTVTTRTYRRPAGAIVCSLPYSDQVLGALLPTSLRPQWAALRPDRNGHWLHLGYLGDERTLAYYQAQLKERGIEAEMRSLEEENRLRQEIWTLPAGGYVRVAVPPTALHRFINESSLTDWVADVAFGVVIVPGNEQDASNLAKVAGALGGSAHCVGEDCPAVFACSDAQRRILKDLKKQFDPENRLKPLMLMQESA